MKYPGLNFTPPKDTVDPADQEGEALVRWKKVGDRYTIVAFEGEELGDGEDSMEEGSHESMMGELDVMYPRPE